MTTQLNSAQAETAHTPGPYPLKSHHCDDDRYVIVTAQGNHYAETFDPAAARLIASAPDMLAALQRILADIQTTPELWKCGTNIAQRVTLEASAAIARATGGEA